MIAALLCASLVARTQDPPRITIEQRALRADVALRKIGEKFGVHLTPDKSTKNDVLLAYLPDVTFTEFRSKTARGWNANWTQHEDAWTLRRTRQQVETEEDEYDAYRERALRARLERWPSTEPLNHAQIARLSDRIIVAGPEGFGPLARLWCCRTGPVDVATVAHAPPCTRTNGPITWHMNVSETAS